MPANLPCPHCKTDLKLPPSFWADRVAPWSCSYCGGLYGISNNFTVFAVPDNFRPLSPLLSQSIANRWCYYSHPCNYVYALCYPAGIPFYLARQAFLAQISSCLAAFRQASQHRCEVSCLQRAGRFPHLASAHRPLVCYLASMGAMTCK